MSTTEIYKRIDTLEMSLIGDETDDDTRGDALEEIRRLEGMLNDV